MPVPEGLCWGWTDVPGPVAREKGGTTLGLEHLLHKLRGCDSPAPPHPQGSRKAAPVLLSRDMIPKPSYLSQGCCILLETGPSRAWHPQDVRAVERDLPTTCPWLCGDQEGVRSWNLPSPLSPGCPPGPRCPAQF